MECLHEDIPMLYIKKCICLKNLNGEIKCIYDVLYVLNLERNFLLTGRIIDCLVLGSLNSPWVGP